MEMTAGEIVRSYDSAKNKRQQISILADLNGCGRDEIEAIIAKEEFKRPQNAPSVSKKPPETESLINWLYGQLDTVEGQIKALESRYKELTAALKVVEEYKAGEKT